MTRNDDNDDRRCCDSSSPLLPMPSADPAPLEFTKQEQESLKSYIWKCDRRLLLYVCIGYATDSLNKMALCPRNLVLKKVRPTYWLTCIHVFSTAFAKNAHALAACRFWFGAVQSGYLTGSLYYISYWYPREQVRKRMGFFFASSGIGGIIIGPLCSGLTSIKSEYLAPWQCIFVFVGLISGVWSLLGPATFITEDERAVITRIMRHQNTVVSDQRISIKQIVMTLKDYKIWLWTLIDFCANGATQVNGMFGPTIIASQGYSSRVAQALSALTNFMAFSGMASIAYVAKFTGGSAYAIMLSNCITSHCFASPQPAAHSPAWEMANQQGNTKPAMAAAFTSAFGGLGPLATAFVYRDQDSPQYVLGHTVCLSMTFLCLLAAIVLRFALDRENKLRDKKPMDISRLTADEIQDLADRHPDFRYKL
ncbi:MFS general substrate transporter [Linderina pennispora]|uniref:MFS general substrate transporter n=1 Tax=Linderina pennispora TaxID=61395 RepID=A0A1Y1WG09_9FUNG|nr:MFS general substrate transporter [Linderina pennispora]ORX72427.1 MFS general substrate transporter [Linderina pennispora]